jgi:hypothetical protein
VLPFPCIVPLSLLFRTSVSVLYVPVPGTHNLFPYDSQVRDFERVHSRDKHNQQSKKKAGEAAMKVFFFKIYDCIRKPENGHLFLNIFRTVDLLLAGFLLQIFRCIKSAFLC